MITNLAIVVDIDTRVDKRTFSNAGILSYIGMGINLGVVANHYTFINNSIRADINIFAYLGTLCDNSC